MKLSLFEEIPVPRPWNAETERIAFREHLEKLEYADKMGFHGVWATEHHFLEEYCASSAPEVFLAALSQRTTNLRLGFGIMHLLPGVNHPARVAERVATLDLVSDGRVEFGTGEGSSTAELEGFDIDPGAKRAMWEEGLRVALRCMADEPFSGYDGNFVRMPPRNVVPKPYQRPHPPVWLGCTRPETIDLAAETGQGALFFATAGPDELRRIVARYYDILTERCVPLPRQVNANVCSGIAGLLCTESDSAGIELLGNRARFFNFGIGHYYVNGEHKPGVTNLWEMYELGMAAGTIPGDFLRETAMVGSPAKLRARLLEYEATGVDEVIFMIPPLKHEVILESLDLFGRKVLPEFKERDELAGSEKAKRLKSAIEAAMARRPPDPPMNPEYTFGVAPRSRTTGEPIPESIRFNRWLK